MTRKMKDSGVEWIGEIPEDWGIVKLKSITKNHYSGGTPTASKEEFYSEDNIKGFPFVNISDITNQRYITTTAKNITIKGIENKNLKLVPKGSLLYAMYASVGKLSVSQIDLYISQAILAFGATEKADKCYLVYYLNSLESFVDYFSSGTTQMNLNAEIVKNFKVVIPLLKIQQKSISDFLDEKTQEIDNIISKTKKAIEEYKKYKQSLITETVTKGLDKNVQMKDSGIEWIGEIPEHWDIIRPNRVCKILRGNSSFQKTDLESKGDYIALQYGRTYKVDIVDDSYRHYVDKSFYKSDQIVEIGDTVLISTSETMEDLGHSCFYNRDDIGLLGGEQMCLKPNKDNIQGKFLYYATKYFHIELNQYATGLKVYRFRLDDLKKINMVLPPKDEQYKIISFLDEKLPLIDQIISTKEKLLIEMEDYKKSLIYETVTGKREVE